MEYVSMGASGLKVSRACLGAMMFGTDGAPCEESQAKRIIDAFLDRGNNFIDTANVYTGGQSEEVVGRALKTRRDSVVIATKGRFPQGPGPNDVGLSRVHLTRALEDSLRRLKTDYIDLYQVHFWDSDTPLEETMATLDGFVRSGKVRYIGCSNFSGSQIVESQWAAERVHGTPFVALQPRYSLLSREIETDVLPAAIKHGLGTLIYSPLAGGMLTGKYKRDEEPAEGTRFSRQINWPVRQDSDEKPKAPRPSPWRLATLTDENFDIVDEVEKVAAELGSTATAVSLAWLLGRRGVTSIIIGPRTFEQQEACLEGFALVLPDKASARLDAISSRTIEVLGHKVPKPRGWGKAQG